MSGKHFTKQEDNWLVKNINNFTSYKELTITFNKIFNIRGECALSDRCSKQLKLKKYNAGKYGTREKEELPIGTERAINDGAIYVKVLNTGGNKKISGYQYPYWMPKQRKIYEDVYGKIADGQFVIFLDGDKDNYKIDNLYCIDRYVSVLMASNQWYTSVAENTLTAIKYCELIYYLKHNKLNREGITCK